MTPFGVRRPVGAGRGSVVRLLLLTLALCLLWALGRSPLTPDERRLYRKVEAAQSCLWSELEAKGLSGDVVADPYRSGFIGVEWSAVTTTLGSLAAKRCATDPLWAVRLLRWFDELGLSAGDRIVVLASSSFPGLLYSVLAAAEERGLNIELTVSLGSSTWGANRPGALWPELAAILRRGGFLRFLRTRPLFYTLGGEEEAGHGMPEEGRALLSEAARADGVELFQNKTLSDVIERKMRLVEGRTPPTRLVVSLGGSEGNMGTDPEVLTLPPGLLLPDERIAEKAGNGALGLSLREGYPVLHLLNLRLLADAEGIAWDLRRNDFAARGFVVHPLFGLALFVLVLMTHRRWTWEEGP
ncbi:MAG: poly-gamma-glutamate system protein [Fretibacterium sp.]|nr:poly-gamma-glutamate system protein [Fretibacterium sp.]